MKRSAESKPSDRQEQHVVKRRRICCGNCVGCLAPDCKNCRFCHDMKRYGGPGRLKKACSNRNCVADNESKGD